MKYERAIGSALVVISVLMVRGEVRAASQETRPFEYSGYADVLKTHVDAHGRVDYVSLRKDPKPLDSFVVSLATVDPKRVARWTKNDQIAFWINSYNALTLKAIVDHRPEKSIREIKGVWDELTWEVAGEALTLNQLENDILRKRFDEPRIHLGLVCASIGCPSLRAEPFSGEKLGEELDAQARLFFADPTKFRIDRKAGKVHISPLFDWFGKDFVKGFGSKQGPGSLTVEWRAVMSFSGKYVDRRDREFLDAGEFEIELLEYDWGLNRQAKKEGGSRQSVRLPTRLDGTAGRTS